jgi:hypothetical protein
VVQQFPKIVLILKIPIIHQLTQLLQIVNLHCKSVIHVRSFVIFVIVLMNVIFSAVCDMRLDFEQFTTNGPASTEEVSGGICQDMLTTTVVSK